MRVKEPSRALPEKAKRSKRPALPHDEDSSDDIAGFTCQHVSHAISVNHVKRAIAENVLSVCSECLKERRCCEGRPVLPSDIWLCLKCGFQGCGRNSEGHHSLKHYKSWRTTESHCITVSLSTWIIWCYECDEKLSTQCNKKVLAQTVDFLQKHVSKTQTGAFSRILKLCEEKCETGEKKKGRKGSSVPSVKGISNLGNTCFFNAVMQNLAQSYILMELMNENKENGTKLKIFPSPDSQLDPLIVELSSPGPLTSALLVFLHSMKETEKGPLSPKVLFNQLCQKAPRFKGFQQQDSQELLHYLLDAVRTEETKRIQASILKAFNNPTTKTADEDTRKKVKAYGREGVKMNFIDRIFIGELTSTVMCEECANISSVNDPFIDISLPIIEERVSKPVLLGRMSKCRSLQATDNGQYSDTVTIENTPQPRATKNQSSSKDKNQLVHGRKCVRKWSSGEDRAVVVPRKRGPPELNGASPAAASTANTESLTESATEGSEREAGPSESSADADSEASESESAAEQPVLSASPRGCRVQPRAPSPQPPAGGPPTREPGRGEERVAEALSELRLSSPVPGERDFDREDRPQRVPSSACSSEEKRVLSPRPPHAFQTLSRSYVTASKECSLQSCFYQFSSMELLMGNNKLLCENCTEKKRRHQKETGSAEKKAEGVYTNARKQLLISAVPVILILHLKRFHQAGLSLRKVNRHVDFPLVLDLAPFCSATCKNVSVGDKVLYGLYGVVEHSGSMRGGHYTAYVKVRTPSRKLLQHITGKTYVPDLKEPDSESTGQWVHVSDTYVQVVPESRALSAQAYLLFYERIL
ncbi:ubiquitin carboxyl-terminal hydrolase 45 isoform X1 [Mustela erminea]|uniref:ubiquitin carboxyl-terminal hydrolase 45 isoform X1 n=1 Tax=Mustela erminea TaxID=36723 RepID=UPI001386DF72|nr:ubiquitin carboxyl-terminal hydrolase 45 isoform X1 [Mustela erminea]